MGILIGWLFFADTNYEIVKIKAVVNNEKLIEDRYVKFLF